MKCQGTSKRSGKPCKKSAMRGRTVCRAHGGASLQGIASPSWKEGRYSKYLPTRLIPHYEQARNDRELGDLTHEIHVIDALITERMAQLDTKESGALWAQLAAQSVKVDEVSTRHNPATWMAEVLVLQELIRAGASEWAKVSEVVTLMEKRKAFVESERKRLVELRQILTLEQANNLIVAIAESVKRNVRDRGALEAINADLVRITGSAVP